MPVKTHKYSNGEVTVVWKPDVCIHSAICFRGLPDVFNPKNRPWVEINGASTDKIIDQVRKCTSGAVSYFMNAEKNDEE
ncbi:(4Fe-4S)-binding protein [Panacibacter ginsenosidivorans]|uniref:(4Fe-4S)-binding protein n=1 Tax=Panacibacter ginsenosidivorans TaxID=1813871 RepID=A0A5B8V966_9BACT|nr:(4Fe-4S)-binding protein [Panacibacter ginsenosidivorans]QEC68060.1 (4Fe-4S)-binding protein [Panacibacter ginsenosidivorans]